MQKTVAKYACAHKPATSGRKPDANSFSLHFGGASRQLTHMRDGNRPLQFPASSMYGKQIILIWKRLSIWLLLDNNFIGGCDASSYFPIETWIRAMLES